MYLLFFFSFHDTRASLFFISPSWCPSCWCKSCSPSFFSQVSWSPSPYTTRAAFASRSISPGTRLPRLTLTSPWSSSPRWTLPPWTWKISCFKSLSQRWEHLKHQSDEPTVNFLFCFVVLFWCYRPCRWNFNLHRQHICHHTTPCILRLPLAKSSC